MQEPFYKNAVRPVDLKILEALSKAIDPSFYLAGGTALSLHLGHRYSYDLDFFLIIFSSKCFENTEKFATSDRSRT